jgi:hypothetical protein
VARVRRPSVRLWQTELFVLVIVVAMLILSVSLSQDLQRTLRQLGESERLSNVSALAAQLGGDFPLTTQSRAALRDHMEQFRLIYGDDVWVYAPDGAPVDSAHQGGPPAALLEQARLGGLNDAFRLVGLLLLNAFLLKLRHSALDGRCFDFSQRLSSAHDIGAADGALAERRDHHEEVAVIFLDRTHVLQTVLQLDGHECAGLFGRRAGGCDQSQNGGTDSCAQVHGHSSPMARAYLLAVSVRHALA